MDDIKDRRSFDRLIFSDVSASIFKNYWYYNLSYTLLTNLAFFLPVKSFIQNLSASGSLILSHSVFKKGDAILLMITNPGKKRIIIKGKVRWINAESSQIQNIGIQFLAFSHWRKYNSFKIQKQLNLLILLKNQMTHLNNNMIT